MNPNSENPHPIVNVDSGLEALEVSRLDRLLRLLRGQDPRTGLDVSSYSLRLRIKWYLEQELRFHPRISKMPYIRNLDLPRSGVGSLLPHKIPHTDWEARGDELETLSQDYQDKVTLIQSERHYRDLLERWPRNAERGLSVPKSDEEFVSFASWLTQLRIQGKSLSMDSLDEKISGPIVNVDSGLKALDVPRLDRVTKVLPEAAGDSIELNRSCNPVEYSSPNQQETF
jgi:hypothetical protein